MNRRDILLALTATPVLLMTPFTGSARIAGQNRFGTFPAAGQIQRVIAAGSPAAVLLYALAPETLLGWPMPVSKEARALLPAVSASLAETGRLAGRASTASLEALMAQKPDLILDIGNRDKTHLAAATHLWQHTGIPSLVMDGELAASPAQIRQLAALLGKESRAEALAQLAEILIGHAMRLRQNNDRPPTRIYYGRGHDGLETGLAGALNLEVITEAGAINVASALGQGHLRRISPEQLLTWDPDIILTQSPHFTQQLYCDTRWKHLSAVRKQQAYLLPAMPFGWIDGPTGINRLLGLQWLLTLLYPDDVALQTDNFTRLSTLFETLYGVSNSLEVLNGPSTTCA